jgi:hypothetical protein
MRKKYRIHYESMLQNTDVNTFHYTSAFWKIRMPDSLGTSDETDDGPDNTK